MKKFNVLIELETVVESDDEFNAENMADQILTNYFYNPQTGDLIQPRVSVYEVEEIDP